MGEPGYEITKSTSFAVSTERRGASYLLVDSLAPALVPIPSDEILIADDHETVRLGLRLLLESQDGWKVCGEADTGEAAIDKTKQLRPDIVILDIAMPVLNGLAAAKAIREFYPDTAIVIYSMYSPEAFLKEAKRLGLEGYISKCESREKLLNAVAAAQCRLSSSP